MTHRFTPDQLRAALTALGLTESTPWHDGRAYGFQVSAALARKEFENARGSAPSVFHIADRIYTLA